MQLRYLQTRTGFGVEQNSTVIFPMPLDVIRPLIELLDGVGKPATGRAANGADPAPLAAAAGSPCEEMHPMTSRHLCGIAQTPDHPISTGLQQQRIGSELYEARRLK